jgi:hypothetical protein
MTATSQAQTVKNHDLSITGVAVAGSARGTLMLVGKSKGPLHGSFEMSLWYNPVTNEVTGGTWKLTIARPGAEAAAKADGALAGSITGGSITLDKHGKVNSIAGVQISIRRSMGQYSRVGKGSGKFSGTLDLRRQHPLKGELQISFAG